MKFDQGMACLALALSGVPAIAGQDGSNPNSELSQLVQRLEHLEQSNRQLQHRLAEIELDEKEEAMASRLADLEIELLSLRKQARAIGSIEGISAGAAITMVAQKAPSGETIGSDSQLNYRADVSVTLPGGTSAMPLDICLRISASARARDLISTPPASAAPPIAPRCS